MREYTLNASRDVAGASGVGKTALLNTLNGLVPDKRCHTHLVSCYGTVIADAARDACRLRDRFASTTTKLVEQ